MHIDRAKFLALTASLAAGCVPQTPPPQDQPATVVGPTALVHVQAPPPAPPPPDPKDDEPALANQPESETEYEEPSFVAGEGRTRRPASGPALSCAQLRAPPGPFCESFDTLHEDCETIVGSLEQGVAQRTIRCLQAKSGTRQICDMLVTPRCAERALAGVPRRASTVQPCRGVAAACGGGVWQSKCETFLSAVVPPMDAHLINCMTEGCELTACFFDL
jgi:hypothetical protein